MSRHRMLSPRRHVEVCIAVGGFLAAAVAPSHAGVSAPQIVSAPTTPVAWHVAKPVAKPVAKRVPPLTGAIGLTPTAGDLVHRIQRRWPVESISGVRPCDLYDCHWADELDDDPHTVAVCSACCWDDRDNADQLVNDLTNWLNTQTTGDPQ